MQSPPPGIAPSLLTPPGAAQVPFEGPPQLPPRPGALRGLLRNSPTPQPHSVSGVSGVGGRLIVHGDDLEASADRITLSGTRDYLLLEGHVELTCTRQSLQLKAGADSACALRTGASKSGHQVFLNLYLLLKLLLLFLKLYLVRPARLAKVAAARS